MNGYRLAFALPKPDRSGLTAEAAWDFLAMADAATSLRATNYFAAKGAGAVEFLAKRLAGMPNPSGDEVAGLIRRLNAPGYRDRDAAEAKLKLFDRTLLSAPLRRTLGDKPSDEVRSRIEAVLGSGFFSGDNLRRLRAVQILAWIDADESRGLGRTGRQEPGGGRRQTCGGAPRAGQAALTERASLAGVRGGYNDGMNRTRSRAAFARAKNLIPGGVNSPARAFGAVGGEPLFIARGEGPYLFDLDGNRYLDFIGSWGPMILGHAHPRVVEAAVAAAAERLQLRRPVRARERSWPSWSSTPCRRSRWCGFVSSGTEAAMSAVRLARGFTGRDVIVKFAGCYHGHVDALLVSAGSSALTLGVPNSPGVPAGCTADTLVLRVQRLPGARARRSRRHGDADRRRDARAGRRQHGPGGAVGRVPRANCAT